jgi:hypothetical protein
MTRSLQETTKDSVPLGVNKSESFGWASKKPTRKSLLKRNGHFAITVAKHLKKASIGGFSLCRIKSGNNKDRVFKGQLDRIREAEGTSILKPIQPSDGEAIKHRLVKLTRLLLRHYHHAFPNGCEAARPTDGFDVKTA